jgi:hypothetical protein
MKGLIQFFQAKPKEGRVIQAVITAAGKVRLVVSSSPLVIRINIRLLKDVKQGLPKALLNLD